MDAPAGAARLSGLLQELVQARVPAIVSREILCAAGGLKAARLTIRDDRLHALTRILPPYGLALRVSDEKYGLHSDAGKGGWSSRFGRAVPPDDPDGYWVLHLSLDAAEVRRASEYDAAFDHSSFGDLLGIPRCCQAFYRAYESGAFHRQGDVLPFTWMNTREPPPYDPWTNYATQYFGRTLLSFAACSFTCQAAADVARRTYGFLRGISPSFADAFLNYQRKSVLYTEYEGVFLLQGSRYQEGLVHFEGVQCTADDTPLAGAMARADNLCCPSAGVALVRKGSEVLAACEGDSFAVCVFRDSFGPPDLLPQESP